MDINRIKKAALEEAMNTPVLVCVNANHEGCELPERLVGDICLLLGHNLPAPIEDYWADNEGFEVGLLFSTGYFKCRVPWEAVYAFASEDHKQEILF